MTAYHYFRVAVWVFIKLFFQTSTVMKNISLLAIACSLLLTTTVTFAQNAKPSPAATTSETLANGATITINYSQPALKGRTMGKDVEPMEDKVWRAGANEATVFETSKDITIDGKSLPAGKYGFFVLVHGGEWTLIFNKTWKQWGAFQYKEADDALRVAVKAGKTKAPVERLTYTISKSGAVSLAWGNTEATFHVR
ncbi:Protein of unknown function [Hydrobacter penzbergensis]|uniref:DUF2911 domain-containing protein n=2 Tax=Hydrobacter penzbergensis TaxID=1235997 RepID=A0A8X8LCG3_9BACT|nr:Protein of unknown function [Hydrobacter penzbergensis]